MSNQAKVQISAVSPMLAAAWLETGKYHGQRRINENIVGKYAQEMARGEWGLGESAIVFGVRPSGKHLLNGQHRLRAIIESGTTQRFLVAEEPFDTDAEMDAAYSAMDRGKVRTLAQGLTTLGTAEVIGVTPYCIGAAKSAALIIANDFNANKSSTPASNALSTATTLHDVLTRWQAPIYAYDRSLHGADKHAAKWFMRAPVFAIGMITFRFQPEKATDFWARTVQNDGLQKGTPEHRLFNFLASNTVRERGVAWYCRAVACCWNDFFDGRQTKQLRTAADKPIAINGTPWRGGDVDALSVLGVRK